MANGIYNIPQTNRQTRGEGGDAPHRMLRKTHPRVQRAALLFPLPVGVSSLLNVCVSEAALKHLSALVLLQLTEILGQLTGLGPEIWGLECSEFCPC